MTAQPGGLTDPPEMEVVERAAGVFIDRLDRLLQSGVSLADARRVALLAAVASIRNVGPDSAQWSVRIQALLAKRSVAAHRHPRPSSLDWS